MTKEAMTLVMPSVSSAARSAEESSSGVTLSSVMPVKLALNRLDIFCIMLTLGIPEFRLEKKVVNAEIDILREMGVEFKTGVEVGRDVTLPELRRQGYEAFYLGIGASKGTPVGCKGDDLEGVWTGLDFLRDVNTGKKPEVGEQVAVVGGGNVAMCTGMRMVRA